MNATSLPFDRQTTTTTRSLSAGAELAPREEAVKPDVLPYFSWAIRWPVSTAGLWGSYLKSLLGF